MMPAAPLVGRRHDAPAGGILLVDRQRPQRHPVHGGQWIVLPLAGILDEPLVELRPRGAVP